MEVHVVRCEARTSVVWETARWLFGSCGRSGGGRDEVDASKVQQWACRREGLRMRPGGDHERMALSGVQLVWKAGGKERCYLGTAS